MWWTHLILLSDNKRKMRLMVFQNLNTNKGTKWSLTSTWFSKYPSVRYFAGLDGGEGFKKLNNILFSNLKDQYNRFITFCIDNRDIIPASAKNKVDKNLQFIRFGFPIVYNRVKINRKRIFNIWATNYEMELVGAQIPGRPDLRLTSTKSVICM